MAKRLDPGVISEVVITDGEEYMKVIADLISSIIRDGKVPKDWEENYIVNVYKGKGDALYKRNYRGLELPGHVMKLLERFMRNK